MLSKAEILNQNLSKRAPQNSAEPVFLYQRTLVMLSLLVRLFRSDRQINQDLRIFALPAVDINDATMVVYDVIAET